MDASSALTSRREGQHPEQVTGPSSPPLTPSAVPEATQQFMTNLAYHRLCALTGMPQELIKHPHCGHERFAEAVYSVLAARRRSFYNVLVACLDERDRADLYRSLHSRNGASNSDHIRYAEICCARDRSLPRRLWETSRAKLTALFQSTPTPPDTGAIEDLVDTSLAGFPQTITKQQVMDCIQHTTHGHFQGVVPDADDLSSPPRRNGNRNRKGDTGNHHGNGNILLPHDKITSTAART